MNIFYLDEDPIKAAAYHNNKHVVKMIVESCQILSTAHRVLDGVKAVGKVNGRQKTAFVLPDSRDNYLYKTTHMNHPSVVWARQNIQHYMYLANLTNALCAEYTERYNKVHLCKVKGLPEFFIEHPPLNIDTDASNARQIALAMPDDSIVPGDAVASYRRYYMLHKKHINVWKNNNIPYWYCVDAPVCV